MFTPEEYTKLFLENMNDMEKLEAIVFERSAELLLYRAFIREKGFEREFNQRLEQTKAIADEQHLNKVLQSEYK